MSPAIKRALPRILAFALAAASIFGQAGSSPQTSAAAPFLPAASDLPAGWTAAGIPEFYEGEGLAGYIDGGAEIFLSYDFRRVDVGRYVQGGGDGAKEIVVDVFRMGTPLDAFGIFSIRREGDEPTLDLGGSPNWVLPPQSALAAGPFFVNIVGFATTGEDMAGFVRLVWKKLAAAGNRPFSPSGEAGLWAALPRDGLLPGTIRYLKGPLAAQAESEILAPGFWAFAAGTEAVSAKYEPDGRKLVLLDFKADPAGLPSRVRDVLAAYLQDVKIQGEVVSAKNGAGHVFLFAGRGRRAALVFGKKDEAAARSLLGKF